MREPGSSQAGPEGALLDNITAAVGGVADQENSGPGGKRLHPMAEDRKCLQSLTGGRSLPTVQGSLSLTTLVRQAASAAQHGRYFPAVLPATLMYRSCSLAALGLSHVRSLDGFLPLIVSR